MIMGFFTKKSVEGKKKDACNICGLYKTCRSPKMKYTGMGKKKILIVGEAPGRTEDEDWKELGYDEPTQFIGHAGNLLRRKLKKFGVDLDRDCWKANSIFCRPLRNRKPTKKEIKLCKPNIDKAIEELRPKFIWLLGNSAIESFYLGRFSNLSISRWRRLCIPDKKANAWIFPMYHPSYLLRNETDKNLETTYNRDLKLAVSCLKKEIPKFEDFDAKISILLDIDSVADFLERILRRNSLIAFDYETTALKPYGAMHKIWCIAINGKAFPYDYYNSYTGDEHWSVFEKRKVRNLWREILLSSRIKKIAHNLKFEDSWSRNIFGVEKVNGWKHCTMTTAHILDSRRSFTGLKFQAYINYGVEGYEQDVKRFLSPKGDDEVNRLNEVPLEKLLKYNALDSILTLRLYQDQKRILLRKRKLKYANDFFLDGLLSFANAQQVGICADKEYYLEQEKRLDMEIKKLEVKLISGKEARLFKKKTGRNLKIAKDLSVMDLRILLFDVLSMKVRKKTTKANLASVDHDVLSQIKIPFTKRLLQRRKLFKIRNTYLAQFTREIVGGKIHPFLDLHTVATFRSSAARPNVQNIPTRDEDAKRICRSGIFPSLGNKLVTADYSAMEVRIAACHTKDPVLIEYINDPTTDMHRDQAKELFLLNDKQVTKKIRFYAKNQFTFPEFYGSWYKACAKNLWEFCIDLETGEEVKVKQHLKNKGINDYDSFERHVKRVESKFWRKFNIYVDWKTKVINEYQKKGYVEMFFGHRRGGYLTNNMVLNSSIQGCLQGHSKVETKDGLIPIKKLEGKFCYVWTGFKWALAVGMDMGKCQLATITLSSGLKVPCDIRHELKTIKNIWKSFKDFKVDDYVALPKIDLDRRKSDDEVNPNYEKYRYDKIVKIEIHDKIESTYTMMVCDEKHQFVSDGVIQKNTAFHCLLWSFIQLDKEFEKRKYGTKIVAQIHDEIILDLIPEEEEEILFLLKYIMTKAIRKKFGWIIVPLEIEIEMTEVDGSWYNKKEFKYKEEK